MTKATIALVALISLNLASVAHIDREQKPVAYIYKIERIR